MLSSLKIRLTLDRGLPLEDLNGPVILDCMSDVTEILDQISAGDPKAAEQLLPLVYNELRTAA